MAGQVIGINGQISTRWGLRSSTGLGYAASARQIRLWLPRLTKAGGRDVLHGRLLGAEFDASDEALWKVPCISDVFPGSQAEKCGLKTGDRITDLDGRAMENAIQLAQALRLYPEDYEAPVAVEREGKRLMLKVKFVGEKPGSLGITLASPGKADQHVRIAEVAKGSASQEAGLKQGDEILEIDRVELKMDARTQFRLLNRWLKVAIHAGDPARIKVRRKGEDGKPATLEVRVMPR
jgi:S1-C subfamily serine protease